MTLAGVCIVLAEELIFGYAVFVVSFQIFAGWWNHFDKYHIAELVEVGVSKAQN